MLYRNDILALAPDHYWTWDNTHNDIGVGGLSRPTNQVGGNTAPVTGTAFTEDATASLHVNGPTSRTECADSTFMNGSVQQFRSFGGWFKPLQISRPPGALFKEGGGTNNFAVLLGFGNVMLAQSVDKDDHDVYVYSDRPLKPNRAYHYMCTFKASDSTAANNGEFALFIDGIKQSISSGNPFDTTKMAGHSADIDWGDPDGGLNLGWDIGMVDGDGSPQARIENTARMVNRPHKWFLFGKSFTDVVPTRGLENSVTAGLDYFERQNLLSQGPMLRDIGLYPDISGRTREFDYGGIYSHPN